MSEVLKEEIERFLKEKSICILEEQLKRLQAENDGLKSQLDFEIQKRETENELLKRLLNEKVKTLDKMTGIYSARLCKKYKQALEEIREIASTKCPLLIDEECTKNERCIYSNVILHKISEVINER